MLSRGYWCFALAAWLSQGAAALAAERASMVRVNGVALHVLERTLAGTPAELARRLAGRWGERLPAGAGPQAGREVLGRQRGPFHETLTLLPGPRPGLSRLIVAVHDLRGRPEPMPRPPLALPAAARVVNVVQFGASLEAATAFTIDAPGAPGTALARLWPGVAARGWQPVVAPASVTAPGAAVWAQRGAAELVLVAVPATGRSRVVLLVVGAAAGASP